MEKSRKITAIMEAKKLLKQYRIISEQMRSDELQLLLEMLETVLRSGVEGDVAEFGCYEGTAALFEARLLESLAPHKQLWLYDSFEGLPDKTSEDMTPLGEQFAPGVLRASKARLERHFYKAGLKRPQIVKAWFYELTEKELPNKLCFAFLDGDYYESIKDSLKIVTPRMQKGGVIVVDDYQNQSLPGAKKAVDEWAVNHGLTVRAARSLGIITL